MLNMGILVIEQRKNYLIKKPDSYETSEKVK